jgi:uncharacterized delta-60 repeat protein
LRFRSPIRLHLEALEDRSLPSTAMLDPSFGAGGVVTGAALAANGNSLTPQFAALQPNGNIIVAGSSDLFEGAVARLTPAGVLDPSFGSGGLAGLSSGPGGLTLTEVSALAVDSQGRILLAGSALTAAGDSATAIVRLTSDGAIDTTFGTGGFASCPISIFELKNLAVGPGDQVLAAGTDLSQSQAAVDVVRYTAAGALDPSFGSGGEAVATYGSGSSGSTLADLVGLPDGRVLLGGIVTFPGLGSSLTLTRLTGAGALDPSFNELGFVALPNYTGGGKLVVAADGSIIAGGALTQANPTPGTVSPLSLSHFQPDGAADLTFGNNGDQQVPLPAAPAGTSEVAILESLKREANGQLVLLSTISAPNGSVEAPVQAVLNRLKPNGLPDASFAPDGFAVTDAQFASGLAVQSDGNLLVLDSNPSVPPFDFGQIERYLAPAPSSARMIQVASDVAFDPTTATWYISKGPGGGPADSFVFGVPGWVPVFGDWNGDGSATVGVFDPTTATWYLRNENSAGAPDAGTFQYGVPGWTPVVGDWTGSGQAGIGVVDPVTSTWYLRNSAGAGSPDMAPFQFGAPGWRPVVGDWTGSGTTGIGVFDPTKAIWYLRNEASPGATDEGLFQYGTPGWLPVAGDWNGDGTTSVGVVDPVTAFWYLRNEDFAGGPDAGSFQYGLPGWIPLAGPV